MRIADLSKDTLRQAAWLPFGLIAASLLVQEWDPLVGILLDAIAVAVGLVVGGILLLRNRHTM